MSNPKPLTEFQQSYHWRVSESKERKPILQSRGSLGQVTGGSGTVRPTPKLQEAFDIEGNSRS